ncbi:MAG TPA: C1 family peptidase, partial [Syntrophobacteraceae bacterium]|nr:C1 family peptidase [Syntrophobacteraceae bacterium]
TRADRSIGSSRTDGVMHLDAETRERMYLEYLNAPKSHIDAAIAQAAPPTAFTLLDHIVYTPSDRNQGSCGNCWVWTSTALFEIKHSVETGVKDRLSLQWFDSAFYGWYPPDSWQPEGPACNGGNLAGVATFYNSHVFVPWSNENAYFQDENGGATPAIPASSISAVPYYYGDVNAYEAVTIETTGVSQAQAIANIQNVLLQKKGVDFSIQWATDADEKVFANWWSNNPESAIFNPDSDGNGGTVCGHDEINQQVSSHDLTIVGYDTSIANNPFWIVLNSWGATPTRLHGLFRMSMSMNYGCTEITQDNKTVYNRTFQNLETQGGKTAFYNTNRLSMSRVNPANGAISVTDRGENDPWPANTNQSDYVTLAGATYKEPSLATFNTRQYMVVKDSTNNGISICSMDYTGSWSSWTNVPGGNTDGAPALVMYRNRLYLFQKDAGKTTVSYASMDTGGNWSSWSTVPKSGTSHSPAAVVQNDRLLFFEVDLNGHVMYSPLYNDGNWYGWYGLYSGNFGNLITNAAPAVANFNGDVWVAVKGLAGTPNADNISAAHTTQQDAAGSWMGWQQLPANGRTSHGPMLAVGPDANTMTITVTGENGNNTTFTQTYSPQGWSGAWTPNPVPGFTSNIAPSLNDYWF